MFIYVLFLLLIYLLPTIALLFYVIPAVFAYFYISFPMSGVLMGFLKCGENYFPGCIVTLRGSGDADSSYRLTADEVSIIKEELQKKGWLTSDGHYEKEKKAFDDTGVPASAWRFYLLFPSVSLFVILFTAVAARLYTGCGYWHSLALTLGERHAATYFGGLLKNMEVNWLNVLSFTNYIT